MEGGLECGIQADYKHRPGESLLGRRGLDNMFCVIERVVGVGGCAAMVMGRGGEGG